jgi:vanillate O-demethylase ferredoxin subunit
VSAQPTINLRVASVHEEADDIRSIELSDPAGDSLPAFTAGAHIDVHLSEKLVRQYSLCNDPSERHRYVIGVLHDPQGRGGSRAIHELKVGDSVRVSAPRNHFELSSDGNSVLVAGGIGITPILCMAQSLASAGRPFSLHYATRTRSRTAFLDKISASSFAASVSYYRSHEPGGLKLNLRELLESPASDDHLYVCGPHSFMDAVIQTAKEKGWPEAHIHYEFFNAEVVRLDTDVEFSVLLASSGKTIPVAPDKTIVEALSQAGVEIPTSCEQGICGTCLTGVLSGEPDHRDMFLTPEEQSCNDKFLPCCSRSKSSVLVLDL